MEPEQAPVLAFTDEQIVAAVKAGPSEIQNQVAIVAMQMELIARRAEDVEEE